MLAPVDRSGARRTLARDGDLWRIERDGPVLRTAHGRPGRPARITTRVCGSIAAAERAYTGAVQARYDDGYRHASAPPGWPGACRPARAVHDRLEQRLQRDPRRPGLAELYVTWLAAQHDPRGTLGALQHRSAPYTEEALRAARRFAWLLDRRCDDEDAALPTSWARHFPRAPVPAALDPRAGRADAARALLERHARHFLGDLGEHAERLTLTWHRGFLDTATLVAEEPAEGDGDDDDPPTDGVLLHRLLRLRSAGLLRALCVEQPESDDPGDGDRDRPIELLRGALAGPPAPALRSFTLGCEPWYLDETDDDFYDHTSAREVAPVLGALDRLGERFPRLEHLSLAGRDLGLRTWRFPHLRHAELHFARPEEPAVAAFARADWPTLRSLRLGLGNYDCAADEADAPVVLGPILAAERTPALRHLALVHLPDADAVCGVLTRSPASARLETLEISSSNLTGAGARELCRGRARFVRLRRLDVAHNFLTPDDERRLRRAFVDITLHIGPQSAPEPRDLDDDEWAGWLRLAALGGAPTVPSGLLRSDDDLPDHLDDRFELLLDRVVRKSVRKALHAQGLGRHSRDEVHRRGAEDIDALSVLLGGTPYFLGDHPSSIDATVFALTLGALAPPGDSAIKQRVAAHANLVAYTERMNKRYFGDHPPGRSIDAAA